MHLTIG